MGKLPNNSWRTFMYQQQIGYLPAHLNKVEKLNTFLVDNLPRGTQWAWVIHDKDYYLPEHEAANPQHKAGTPRAPHLHISIYLPNTKSISAMAKCIGDKENTITKFTGDNAKQNLFSYLVHKTEGSKADGKYVYSYDEIHTNFDYKSYVEGISTAIKSAIIDKDTVMQQVLQGKLRMIDFIMKDDLMSFYLKNKTYVTNLIDSYYKRRMNALKDDDNAVEIIYVEGKEGSGKSSWARKYALKNYRDYAVSSSHNDSVQDYLGQDVMLFDDARPGDFNASDWLKLLDPYNNNCSVCSRYYNKYLNVKCIIITTTTPFEEFFVYAPRKECASLADPVGQFMRRFKFVVKCTGTDTADIIGVHANIHEIHMLQSAKMKRVGDNTVEYRWAVCEKPIKETDVVIKAKHERLAINTDKFDL